MILSYDIPCTDKTRAQEEPTLILGLAIPRLEYYISTKMDCFSHSIGIDVLGFPLTDHSYECRDSDKDDGSSSFFDLANARDYCQQMAACETQVKSMSFRH